MPRAAVKLSPARELRPPTPRQLEILEYLRAYVAEHRMPPTIREICRFFHVNTNAAMCHLRSMQRKGMVEHTGVYRSRGWRPTVASGRCPLCGRPYPKETSHERR
jgi:SOS-response transcriptional repressor LexA